jgi:hypothetical protein
MAGKWLVGILAWAAVVSSAAAQSKSSPKSNPKQEAAQALKRQVNALIAEADAATDPERGYETLRRALHSLAEPSPLAGGERLDLMDRVEQRMDQMRQKMASMSQGKSSSSGGSPEATAAAKKKGQFAPAFGSTSNFTATPVVLPDRRSVRIGISGTFSMVTPTGPLVPVQIPVPTFLYGPGRGVTAGPPEKVFQMFFPSPRGTIIQINSAATVPDGGLASLGGTSSSFAARNEFGVPGLGKLPYGDRLFRNIGQGGEIRTTRVGVSARIISLEEEERRLLDGDR